jgi:hypothetical protein
MDVRRLAAIDMHGGAARPARRQLILGQYLLGLSVMGAIGVWMVTSADAPGWWIFGAWFVGVALNYAALVAHAVDLYRPGVLEAELAGVNIYAQARRYIRLQLWILVPLSMVVFALARLRRRP